jgi:hypothetical protein
VSSNESWWLDDVEARNREHPDSFFIPPLERRAALEPGDSVKLVFFFEGGPVEAERMWVDVISTNPYVGLLLNEPKHITALQPGDRVTFEPQHVASVAVSEEEVGYRVEDKAIVSRRIRDDGEPPHFVYRVSDSLRDGPEDSGWELWAREDDDAYAEQPDNLILWELGWIADKFPALEPLLSSGVDEGQWWWDEETGAYRRRA